jgi:hypothetical protein
MLTMLAEVHAVGRNWGKVKGLCARIVPVLREANGHEASLAVASELAAQAELALGGSAAAAVSGLRACLAVLGRHGFQDPHRLCDLHATLARIELLSGKREQALIAFERARAFALDAHGVSSERVRRLENEIELTRCGARPKLQGRN